MVDAMLQSADALRAYVAGLRSGTPESSGFSTLANELLAANFASHPVPELSLPVTNASAQQAARRDRNSRSRKDCSCEPALAEIAAQA